jgi:hypothetical protein
VITTISLTFDAGQGISGMVLGRFRNIRAGSILLSEKVNVGWDLL